jgi:hypothetical protein
VRRIQPLTTLGCITSTPCIVHDVRSVKLDALHSPELSYRAVPGVVRDGWHKRPAGRRADVARSLDLACLPEDFIPLGRFSGLISHTGTA